eukprot:scaffold6208_cov135-Isochrysis_galbana.AAC.1
MEHPPADARAAPSASEPNDIVMDIASSPKRPRDPAQDNKVSQSATHFDPAMLENQFRTTECLQQQLGGHQGWAACPCLMKDHFSVVSAVTCTYTYDLNLRMSLKASLTRVAHPMKLSCALLGVQYRGVGKMSGCQGINL